MAPSVCSRVELTTDVAQISVSIFGGAMPWAGEETTVPIVAMALFAEEHEMTGSVVGITAVCCVKLNFLRLCSPLEHT